MTHLSPKYPKSFQYVTSLTFLVLKFPSSLNNSKHVNRITSQHVMTLLYILIGTVRLFAYEVQSAKLHSSLSINLYYSPKNRTKNNKSQVFITIHISEARLSIGLWTARLLNIHVHDFCRLSNSSVCVSGIIIRLLREHERSLASSFVCFWVSLYAKNT